MNHPHWFELLPGYENLRHVLEHFFTASWQGLGLPMETGHIAVYHVVMAAFVCVLVTALLLKAGISRLPAEERVIPEDRLSIRTFFELLVEMVRGTMHNIIGPTADRYLPLIGTLAIFILFSNVLGLIPGFQPPTSNFNTTLACAIPVFLATHYYGVKEHGLAYFKHFLGPIIKWYALPLMVIMVFIEIISHLARPLSLALRLLGNMFGDHLVLGVFMGIVAVPLIYPVPIMILGLVVCIVQTLVFCLLSMVYIGLAVAHEEH